MARCGCGSNQQCLSTNPGNQASYDGTGCLYVAESTPLFGAVNQPSAVDLVTLDDSVWTDTGLSFTVPAAGTFELVVDAFIRLHVNVAPSGGTAVVRVLFRIYDETAGTVVPNTQATGASTGGNTEGRYQTSGGSTVHTNVVTTGHTTFKLQVQRINTTLGGAFATPVTTSILEAEGTSMRYNRLA